MRSKAAGRPVKRKPAAKVPPKADARQTKHDLVAGRIVRPHGIHGMMIVEPVPDLIERVRPGHAVTLAESGRKSRVVQVQPHGQRYLVALEGFATRESAESLRGEAIHVRLEDIGPLPPGSSSAGRSWACRLYPMTGRTWAWSSTS